ncbi:MAG: prepilin-type N-terminal cleavage/methylation domain-containing protein, partial [Bacilli bacterium]|nr:prepilin-type N-terminal cleavage/methylation domain-containing protein [Bacilli bacterium]
MKCKYNKGMSIVEILISICIISIVLSLLFTLLI